MEKCGNFIPTKEQAKQMADKYHSDLSGYTEEWIKEFQVGIKATAASGEYKAVKKVLSEKVECIKHQLECAGYEVEINSYNEKESFISVEWK